MPPASFRVRHGASWLLPCLFFLAAAAPGCRSSAAPPGPPHAPRPDSPAPARPRCLAPAEAPGPDLSCRADRDCLIAFDPCGYRIPPFQDSWKPSHNRRAHRQAVEEASTERHACDPNHPGWAISIRTRQGRWIGDGAICIRGQCRTILRGCLRGVGDAERR